MTGSAPPMPAREAPPPAVLDLYAERWKRCSSKDGRVVLRLAILRDFMRELHAERSRALATDQREKAEGFKQWEEAIDALRGSPEIARPDSDLAQVFTGERKGSKPGPPVLPQALVEAIGPERIQRYDREWEAAIAGEAYRSGWGFWTVDVWVRVAEAEHFDDNLGERISPHGAVLFAEAVGADSPVEGAEWLGRWWIVLESKWKTPQFGIDALTSVRNRGAPRWALRFTPR